MSGTALQLSLTNVRMPGDPISCLWRATMLYIPRFGERSNHLWAGLPPLAQLGMAHRDRSCPEPLLEVFTPIPGCLYHSPIEVIVRAPKPGAVLLVRLLNTKGDQLAVQLTTSADAHGFFRLSLPFDDPWDGLPGRPQLAVLECREVECRTAVPRAIRVPMAIFAGPRAVHVVEPRAGATATDPIRISGSALAYEGTVCVLAETRFGQRIGRAVAAGGVFDHADFASELHVAAFCPEVLVSIFAAAPGDYIAVDPIRIPVFMQTKPGGQIA